MSEDAIITIKKGKFKVVVPRSELIDVSETHDGVAFNFKGGLQLYYIDNHMPAATKSIMSNTANSFAGKKIIFNLDNLRQPALVDAT